MAPRNHHQRVDADRPLTGQAVLITGGARRVGRAMALELARQGMDVAITYRQSQDEAKTLVAEIRSMGTKAMAIRADLSKPAAADRIVKTIRDRFGQLHALINNASIFESQTLAQLTPSDFQRHLAINALAPLLLIQKLAPLLAAQVDVRRPQTLGRIVNLIDMHVLGRPMRNHLAYNASKAALLEITRSSALELAPGITVNAIAPGVVDWSADFTLAQRKRYLKTVPLQRAGTPDDVAKAVLYLIRDAHYVTGEIIRLDGGRWLG